MSDMPDIEVARYALRTFNVKDGRLMPVAMPVKDAWKGGVCEAECVPSPWFTAIIAGLLEPEPAHDAPDKGCHCGIYGCLTINLLKRQYPLECMRIITVIAVEGNTIIGDVGLRTQAARIVAYWSPERAVRRICADTCDGATGFAKLDDMLAAYGFEPEQKSDQLLDWQQQLLATFLAPPSRPRRTRFGRLLSWVSVACIMVNLGFFTAGLFTSAEMSSQLFSLGAAAICTGSAVLQRRNLRKAGVA